jgi:Uma2 family endonuclease
MGSRLRYAGGDFMPTEISKRLFTVDDYYKMADAGILRKGDRVELIRGEILSMSPIGPAHGAAVLRATNKLLRIVGDRAILGSQGPVRLDLYNEPEPDIYLLRPKADFYRSAHAGPADVFLIIEMADSSLEYDQDIKMRLYAEMRVAEYWIADIRNDCLIAHSGPRSDGYATIRKFQRGQTIRPGLLPDCPIPVDDVLP